MCGIAGSFAYEPSAPSVDAGELLLVREHMLARGPDDAGTWFSPEGRVGLAHRRLAIIDLSRGGAQPMATADGRFRVVFNGEIYNYRELRRELEALGYRFRSTSDTEVLLYLYAERGAEMVHALRGMYAFAIWDEGMRAIFLARDPFGVKPLYYADDGGTLRFASQVKALLAGGAVDTRADPAGLVGFFLWGHLPEPYTLYKGIHALPAGTSLFVDASGKKRLRQFFDLRAEFAQAAATPYAASREEMREELRAALRDSVRQHLVGDVPVGLLLSSGLDSTTLAGLVAEENLSERANTLYTVTLGFHEYRGTANDETRLAAQVAQHYGAMHLPRWIDREEFRGEIRRLLQSMDQPSIDGVNVYFACRAAKEVGLKVVISGLGGDELFGGYPSFRQIPRMSAALAPFSALPYLGAGCRRLSAPFVKRFASPKYAGLLEYGGSYAGAYLLRRGMFMPWELPEFLDPELVREGWGELQTLDRLAETAGGLASPHCKVAALEQAWYMRNQLLRDSDWASMAHSVELRVPLVDVPLLRAVAPMFYTPHAPEKRDMASACTPPLPSEVIGRPKTGFSIPVEQWLLDGEKPATAKRGLRDWAHTVLGCERRFEFRHQA